MAGGAAVAAAVYVLLRAFLRARVRAERRKAGATPASSAALVAQIRRRAAAIEGLRQLSRVPPSEAIDRVFGKCGGRPGSAYPPPALL